MEKERTTIQPVANMDHIANFYKTHKYLDCTFKFGSQQIGAHKLILAGSSPVFEKMLFGGIAQDVIEICDMNFREFKEVLDYIYTGNINIYSVLQAWNLYYIATKYLLDALKFTCLGYIKNHLTMNNVCISYEYSELYEIVDIREICLADMVNYCNGVFYCYYHMKPSTIRAILDRIKIYDIDLLVNIIKWVIIECGIKELTILPSNIIDRLKAENILKYFKRNCLDFTNCPKIKDDVINDTLIAINDIVECSQDQFDVTVFQTVSPKFCHFRRASKIAGRLDLLQREEFISEFSVRTNMIIFGLSIGTPIEPEYNIPCFDGYICIRICNSDNLKDVIEPVQYFGSIPYGATNFYVNLNNLAVLEPDCCYVFKISFYSPNVKKPLSLHCVYMSENLFSTTNDIAMTFYEMNGSIIRGVSFYPA